MRHKDKRYRINRFTSWRKATLKSMARNLILHESMKTTLKKAKAVQPLAEHLITLARDNDLSARRKAFDILQDHDLVKRLFTDIGPRFADRNGGYTRVVHLGTRRGDNASMVVFELMVVRKKEIKPAKKAKAKSAPSAGEQEHEQPVKPQEKPQVEKKDKHEERKPGEQKPTKKFLGGIRGIFKKERDAL